jgi:hypothetical protein
MVKPFSERREAARDRQIHGNPGQVRVRLARDQLEEKRATTPPPFDSVKSQLGPLVQQKLFETYLKDLVKTAKVERSL